MKIAIYGLGYIGLTGAACVTSQGHTVLGIDVSAEKVSQINAGQSPISEPGVEEMMQKALAAGLLKCTAGAEVDLSDFDIAVVCVGTPSASDGSHNMTYIADVSRQIASTIKTKRERPLVVAYRSTVRPGTIEELITPIFQTILGARHNDVELVYNPEFLREAVAVSDYFNPPKIVIGTKDGLPNAVMDALYRDISAPVFYVCYREAEFTKFVDNSFHAVKIAFANEIGRVSLQIGIDPSVVHRIFISDTKLNVSPYYLRPGGAFGGSCLPKDIRALQQISLEVGANTHLIDSLLRSNEAHKFFLFQKCVQNLQPGAHVLMLGLAFKSESDDLRESPNVDLARKILQAGFKLSIFDMSLEPRKLVGQNLGYTYSQLPQIEKLLISREAITSGQFDIVIDTNGTGKLFDLSNKRVVDINTL
jgi:GDP-mannose 6-dehydrogenase